MAEISNNPVHLINKEGKPMPSALIPFCSFAGNVGDLTRDDFSLAVCDMFHPVLLDGQQCYRVDRKDSSGKGTDRGLFFLVDLNSERSVDQKISDKIGPTKYKQLEEFIYEKDRISRSQWATIHIDTLVPNNGFHPGSYAMTAVRNITVTDNFLSLSMNDKLCMDDDYDNCLARGLKRNVNDVIGCSVFGNIENGIQYKVSRLI